MEADISAAGPDNDNNDMADAHIATIDTVTHFSSSTWSDIPQPQEWVQIREVSEIDIILSTSAVTYRADNACTYDELSDERMTFKVYPVRAEVASMISVFDPKVFLDLLDNQITQWKFSGAVGSTTANPQNLDKSAGSWLWDVRCKW